MKAQRLDVGGPPEVQDPEEDLQQYLDDELGLRSLAESEVSIARWANGDATRAMQIADRKLDERAHILAQLERAREVARAQVHAVGVWLEGAEAEAAHKLGFIDHLLDLYQQDFHPGEKTTKLPHGQLKRRANRDRREWVDEDAALRWQEASAPEDVTRKLNKTALLERLKASGGEYFDAETGEVVEFVRDVPPEEPESFAVVTEGAE